MSARDRAGIAVGLIVAGLLVGLLAFLLARGVGLERSAPPIEELTFERVEFPAPGRIRLHEGAAVVAEDVVRQLWEQEFGRDPRAGEPGGDGDGEAGDAGKA